MQNKQKKKKEGRKKRQSKTLQSIFEISNYFYNHIHRLIIIVYMFSNIQVCSTSEFNSQRIPYRNGIDHLLFAMSKVHQTLFNEVIDHPVIRGLKIVYKLCCVFLDLAKFNAKC